MDGLNSYYLQTDRFIEHLQGEIGTGCIYFKSSILEILIYFDEMDIIGAIVQESGESARLATDLQHVFKALEQRSYIVRVFHLDQTAIFYWAQIPPFRRAKTILDSSEITLEELVKRIDRKKSSCFVDVSFPGANMSCLLFFHQGGFVGGSYSWGAGGLNPSRQEFETFLRSTSSKKAVFSIGHFTGETHPPLREEQGQKAPEISSEDQMFLTNLPTILEEFLSYYIRATRKKTRVDPIALMRQRIVARADEYPFMDPFNPPFDYTGDGIFSFTGSDKAFGENTARAIMECAWDVVDELRVAGKFRTVLKGWNNRKMLEERGYTIIR
ncbi:MAG: hypothetical protein Kow0089_16210 [Desulfobulbaceae bacterium]